MEKSYVPSKEDFRFLNRQDLDTDKNFASQSYWKGVAIHYFKNKRAVTGLVIITVIILLAVFGPMMNSFGSCVFMTSFMRYLVSTNGWVPHVRE